MATKKKTELPEDIGGQTEAVEEEKQLYVAIRPIIYRDGTPEQQYIEPTDDPFDPDNPRLDMSHLSPVTLELVLGQYIIPVPRSKE